MLHPILKDFLILFTSLILILFSTWRIGVSLEREDNRRALVWTFVFFMALYSFVSQAIKNP
jgi:hypothetical protein